MSLKLSIADGHLSRTDCSTVPLFHSHGRATAKLPSPKLVRVRGTASVRPAGRAIGAEMWSTMLGR